MCCEMRGRSGDRCRSPYPIRPTPHSHTRALRRAYRTTQIARSAAGFRPREAPDYSWVTTLPPGVSGIRVGAGTSIGAPCAYLSSSETLSVLVRACPKYRAIRPSSRRQRVPEPSTRACPNLPSRPSLSNATASARASGVYREELGPAALMYRSARRSAEELLLAEARRTSTNAMAQFLTLSRPPSRFFLSTPSDRRI